MFSFIWASTSGSLSRYFWISKFILFCVSSSSFSHLSAFVRASSSWRPTFKRTLAYWLSTGYEEKNLSQRHGNFQYISHSLNTYLFHAWCKRRPQGTRTWDWEFLLWELNSLLKKHERCQYWIGGTWVSHYQSFITLIFQAISKFSLSQVSCTFLIGFMFTYKHCTKDNSVLSLSIKLNSLLRPLLKIPH